MQKIPTKPRIVISLFLGLIVFGSYLRQSWLFASTDFAQFGRSQSRYGVEFFRDEVRAYRDRHGILPNSLTQLGDYSDKGYERDGTGALVDYWQNPYVYVVKGKTFRIVSYGRDGKPGGVGLDCDLASDHIDAYQERIPLSEYLTSTMTSKEFIGALLGAAIMAVISWVTFSGISYWFARLAFVLCVTYIMAVWMVQ